MKSATLIASALESALNQLLKYHPQIRPLANWHGQVIQFELQEFQLPLYMIVQEPIQVYANYGGQCDAKISLNIKTLAQIAQGNSLSQLVKDGQLEVEGDMQLIGRLLTMLSAIDIDLSSPLSRYLGDGLAHRVDQAGRYVIKQGQTHLSSLQSHLTTFLQEELKAVPHRLETDSFSQQVSDLEQQVLKLDKRLQLLLKQADK